MKKGDLIPQMVHRCPGKMQGYTAGSPPPAGTLGVTCRGQACCSHAPKADSQRLPLAQKSNSGARVGEKGGDGGQGWREEKSQQRCTPN